MSRSPYGPVGPTKAEQETDELIDAAAKAIGKFILALIPIIIIAVLILGSLQDSGL